MDGSASGNRHLVGSTGGRWDTYQGGNIIDSGVGLVANTAAQVLGVYTGSTDSVTYVNGVKTTAGNAGAHALSAGWRVGAAPDNGAVWRGKIAEVIVSSGNDSVDDMNKVGSYLATKWGVTWAPILPVTTGIVFHFKADSLALANGAEISTWTDSGPGGFNATAATGQKPLFQTNVVNGLPVARFDGVDDFLTSTAQTSQKPFTFFAVVKTTDLATYRFITGGTGGACVIRYNPDETVQLEVGGTTRYRYLYFFLHCWSFYHSGGYLLCYWCVDVL